MKSISIHLLPAFFQFTAILISMLLTGSLLGCQKDGDGVAERAGQKLDRSMDKVEQKLEQATEQASKQIDKAKQRLAEKTENGTLYLDDSVVTLNVKTAILNDPILKVSEISVITENGVVQLNGAVDSQQIIDKAVGLAQVQKGVKSVLNNLTIRMADVPQ